MDEKEGPRFCVGVGEGSPFPPHGYASSIVQLMRVQVEILVMVDVVGKCVMKWQFGLIARRVRQ